MTDWRFEPWIQTFSGRQFWPLTPQPEGINIEDIAHALSMNCRFNGHCTKYYSVAEHSVYVSKLVQRDLALWGLLHDAAEAFLPDVARPIKDYLTGFRDIEDDVLKVIVMEFGLMWPMPFEIKIADMAILATERSQAMAPCSHEWFLPVAPADIQIEFWKPKKAKYEFMRRFQEIS